MTLTAWCGDPDVATVPDVFACLHSLPFGLDLPPWPILEIAQAAAPSDALLQYGAIGVFLILALGTVRYLFQRREREHDRDIAYREKKEQEAVERAERAEQQLLALNELIRDRLVVELTRATDAASRAAELVGRKEGERR